MKNTPSKNNSLPAFEYSKRRYRLEITISNAYDDAERFEEYVPFLTADELEGILEEVKTAFNIWNAELNERGG